MQRNEYPLLTDFLYHAIFLPKGTAPPPKDIVMREELQVYVKDFGERKDDVALVAEVGNQIVGAVWARIMNDYGHIDDETPSLAISLFKEYRGKGIGTQLMRDMLATLKQSGYARVSLSVQKENYAAEMYRKLGFVPVRENSEEYIVARKL